MALLATPARGADAVDRLIDSLLREMLTTDGDAQLAALERLVGLGDRASVAPLVHMLFWLEPDNHEAIAGGIRLLAGEPGDAPAGAAFFDWMVWLEGHAEFRPHALYDALIGDLYAALDPQFSRFLRVGIKREIRLEEIVWGGVNVDAIPALDDPATTGPEGAGWLAPTDVVLGVSLGGQARAYPLRILAWHELANDVVGGVPVALPYCPLCGAGILYDARGPQGRMRFGSSGLLHHSNKLMFDRESDSLWSQFLGVPVVGELVGSARSLGRLPLVQTTWEAWRARHPDSSVLSVRTGYDRDYGSEGAYRAYRASPDLAFPARVAARRGAKALVFGVVVPGGARAWPVESFDAASPLHARVGLLDVVVLGDSGSGLRAYDSGGRRFAMEGESLRAADGLWRVGEGALAGPGGATLPRLPGHVAYWFAWAGAYGPGD